MPVFEVTAPNGKTYEIEGPPGSTKEQAIAKAQEMYGQTAEYGAGRSALSGLTFGFNDEIEAKVKAAMGQGDYSSNLQAIQAAKKRYEQDNPVTALAAEAAGGLPTALLPFAAPANAVRAAAMATKFGPLATRLLGASAMGAATGALSGAGNAQEDQRMKGAAIGGGAGAVLSPVLGAGATAVKGVAQGIGARVPSVPILNKLNPDFEERANVKLLQALQRDELTPQELQRRVSERALNPTLANKPETLVQAGGQNVMNLADVAAKYPGSATRMAGDLASERAEGQLGRITNDLAQAFRVSGDPTEVSMGLIRAREVASGPLYAKAFAEGRQLTDPRLFGLFSRPSVQSGYKTAQALAAESGGTPLPDINKLQALDLQTLDLIKKGLDDVIFTAKQPGSNIGKEQLNRMNQTRVEMLKTIDELVPTYAKARAAFAGPTRLNEALMDGVEFGSKMSTMTSAKARETLGSLPPSEREQFLVGVLDSVRTNMTKSTDGRDLVKVVYGSPEKREILRELVGQKQFADLERQFIRERSIRTADEKVRGNSATVQRQQGVQDLEADVTLGQSVVNKGVKQGLSDYFMRSVVGPGQGTANALGPKLFNTSTGDQLNLLRDLTSLDETLRQRALRGGAVTGASGGLIGGNLPISGLLSE